MFGQRVKSMRQIVFQYACTVLVSPCAPSAVAVQHVTLANAIVSQLISALKVKTDKAFRSSVIPLWEAIFMDVLYKIVSSFLSRTARSLSCAQRRVRQSCFSKTVFVLSTVCTAQPENQWIMLLLALLSNHWMQVLLSPLQLGALEVRLAMVCAVDVAESSRMLKCI